MKPTRIARNGGPGSRGRRNAAPEEAAKNPIAVG